MTTVEPVAAGTGRDAEWLSVHGASLTFSIGKTILYALIKEGAIRSVVLRLRGRVTGNRLIYADSVRDYLASLEQEQAMERKGGAK